MPKHVIKNLWPAQVLVTWVKICAGLYRRIINLISSSLFVIGAPSKQDQRQDQVIVVVHITRNSNSTWIRKVLLSPFYRCGTEAERLSTLPNFTTKFFGTAIN